jgi:tetratricopeptide (TPR) repeat protein
MERSQSSDRRTRQLASGSRRNGSDARGFDKGWTKRRWRAFVLTLAASPAAATVGMDQHDCFLHDHQRRIPSCTELIERPSLPTQILGPAYAMRALAYSLKGQYESAIRDYDAAITLVPDSPLALNNRAWAHFKVGRPFTGLPDVEEALRLQPASPHAYDTRAHIRQWLGDSLSALRDYEAAMHFGGERMVRLYQCGLAAHKLYTGAIDGAETPDLRRALQICVENTTCDPLPPDEECRAVTS